MTPKEIKLLNDACKMAGIDASKIQPNNPFSKSGGTPSLLQAAVAEIDPVQAAKWRVEAGGGLSVATLAEMQNDGEFSQQAVEDLYMHDPDYVQYLAKEREDYETQMLKKMEAESHQMRLAQRTRQNGGNEAMARRQLEQEELADQQRQQQMQESARHASEMQARIASRRGARF